MMFVHLTSGSFSEIWVDRASRICSKEVQGQVAPHNHRREAAILQDLTAFSHPNVVPLLGLEQTADRSIMTFPFYDTGILEFVKDPANTAVLPGLCQDLLDAVAFIHSAGVMHRDICPNNIMVDRRVTPPKVVLIDFGIAWSRQHTYGELDGQLVSQIGTGYVRHADFIG